MIHPDTELRFISDEIGVGVVATRLIPKGTIVWIADELDIVLKEDFVDSLDEVRQKVVYKYSYLNEDGDYVINWDHSRYMNHSFRPNCIDTVFDFELAVRDILPGEQLTCDYGIMGEDEEFECLPEEGTNRTRVKADDYLHRYPLWDEWAREAFRHFHAVEQPLKHLIKDEYIDEVNAVAAGLRPLPSILTLFTEDPEDEDEA
ncbi:SET domain-containing protein [Paenibacillus flagellatus]|uniref:SET domain-containing protein-lysine N-methyltransferase n=1 Tax=Paenibacillus flagellatus TaxID=2211139 RepID=A0A2V5K039_9BACL|nr:SET domain-containing protein [Paenibacillus flagellatus]PYI52478.1 SET domain-containing protein-lysine N-methyltransferase [Paenibacillus flagellatus]